MTATGNEPITLDNLKAFKEEFVSTGIDITKVYEFNTNPWDIKIFRIDLSKDLSVLAGYVYITNNVAYPIQYTNTELPFLGFIPFDGDCEYKTTVGKNQFGLTIDVILDIAPTHLNHSTINVNAYLSGGSGTPKTKTTGSFFILGRKQTISE